VALARWTRERRLPADNRQLTLITRADTDN
jgi:hypothetical protein